LGPAFALCRDVTARSVVLAGIAGVQAVRMITIPMIVVVVMVGIAVWMILRVIIRMIRTGMIPAGVTSRIPARLCSERSECHFQKTSLSLG
jgi:hypothetical protein